MKKIVSILVVLFLSLSFVLVGCGSGGSNVSNPTGTSVKNPANQKMPEVKQIYAEYFTKDSGLYFRYAGVIENTGSEDIVVSYGNLEIYANDGSVLENTPVTVAPAIIKPGEKAYVMAENSSQIQNPKDFKEVKVKLNPAYDASSDFKLEFSKVNFVKAPQKYSADKVTAVVTNPSDKTVSADSIAIILLDENKQILHISHGYISSEIEPKGTASLDQSLYAIPSEVLGKVTSAEVVGSGMSREF